MFLPPQKRRMDDDDDDDGGGGKPSRSSEVAGKVRELITNAIGKIGALPGFQPHK